MNAIEAVLRGVVTAWGNDAGLATAATLHHEIAHKGAALPLVGVKVASQVQPAAQGVQRGVTLEFVCNSEEATGAEAMGIQEATKRVYDGETLTLGGKYTQTRPCALTEEEAFFDRDNLVWVTRTKVALKVK